MVDTRQSSKASTIGSKAVGPSVAAHDSEHSSGSESSSSQERRPKRRAIVQYTPSTIIEAPADLRPSVLKEIDLDSIALKNGIPRDFLLLLAEGQLANNPPKGYIAWSRFHCSAGGIPSLNGFLINFFNYIECAPFQFHPNSVTILISLYVIFQSLYCREPQPHEVRHLCTLWFGRNTNASVISLEGRTTKVVEGIKSNVGPYKDHWFFVRDPTPCYREFRTTGE